MTTPLRMCLGCRRMLPKPELIRVVRSPDGQIALDLTGKAAGRGAYICKSLECLKKARKSRALSRAFKENVEDVIYDTLETQMENNL